MAAESVSNLTDLLKEVWTQDRLERQFYDGTRWADKVERTSKYTIGRQAQVPLETSLPGGTSNAPAAGSSALNAADPLHVDRADYTLQYMYQQVALEFASMAQADSVGVRSTVDAVDQTVASNVLAMRKEFNRQVAGNGDALIAQCTTTSTSTTIQLLSTGYGYDAIVRGWLRPGHTVDIGTTASEAAIAGDVLITAVAESSSAPTITVSGSAVSTTSSHYVSIANNRSGTTSYETSGLRTIVGSTSSTIGTIVPSASPFWKPAQVDTTTTLVSLDLLLTLQQNVYQKTGKYPKYVTTSPYQAKQLYELFQSQVRFSGDGNTSAGAVEGFSWNGMSVNPDPDIPNRELYLLDLPAFLFVTSSAYGKPTWVSDIEGAGGRLRWAQGTTQFKDALAYPVQLGIKRRNSSAAAIGLTA